MKKRLKKGKKWLSGVLLTALLISAFSGTAYAKTGAVPAFGPQDERTAGTISAADNAGGISMLSETAKKFEDFTQNETLRPYLKNHPEKIRRGVDVSSYQGTIDWAKVKKDPAGLDFAIIRAGLRGTSTGTLEPDSRFAENIKGAIGQGFNCGVYIFSQAVTVDEAKKEADFAVSQLKKAQISPGELKLPVFMDVEFAADGGGRLHDAKLSKSAQTNICNAFIRQVEAAGYQAGVYADASMLKDHMNPNNFVPSAAVWMAEYKQKSGYTGTYSYWQCADNGRIEGISGDVDLNFFYEPEKGSGYQNPVPKKKTAWPRLIIGESDLNIREYAGTDFKSLGKVPVGTKISVLDTAPDGNGTLWYQTKYGSVTGYVSSSFTKPFTSGAAKPSVSSRTTSAVKVKWKKASYADGYVVYRSASKNGTYKAVETIRSQKTVSYTDKKLSAGKIYYYKIRTFRKENGGTYYGAYSAVLKASTKAAKPSGLSQNTKKNNPSSITLKWKKASGVSGYQIYRSAAKNGKYKKVKTISKADTLTWKDTKLTAGTEYYYKIRAFKKTEGTTLYSDFTSAVTMHTKMSSRLTVKTKKKAVMRADAGTSYKTKVTVPKNKKFSVIYKTKDKSGKAWYKIKYKKGKKSYTGYIPASYTKKA